MTAAVILGALFLVVGCSDDQAPHSTSGTSSSNPDPGPIHVHGLGVDPADDALYIASHTGLFRLPKGASTADRVADRYQDTMAFTVTGPNRFLGSGHPDTREDLPPFLGLIESNDAGESWEEISLQGEVDFHLLAASEKRIYGFGSFWETNEAVFLASGDGGQSWMKRQTPAPLVGLAISPTDPQMLVAADARGLFTTRDAGKTWKRSRGPSGLLAWPRPDRLYLTDPKGSVELSTDQGRSWHPVGHLPSPPSALGFGSGRLYASTHDGAIWESRDEGSTWSKRFSQ